MNEKTNRRVDTGELLRGAVVGFFTDLFLTITTGHNCFARDEWGCSTAREYHPPRLINSHIDGNGYPVNTYAAQHSRHVSDLYSGTTHPGDVTTVITSNRDGTYTVGQEPWNTEFDK